MSTKMNYTVTRVDNPTVDPRGARRSQNPPMNPDPQTSPYHLLIIALLSQAERELAHGRRKPTCEKPRIKQTRSKRRNAEST